MRNRTKTTTTTAQNHIIVLSSWCLSLVVWNDIRRWCCGQLLYTNAHILLKESVSKSARTICNEPHCAMAAYGCVMFNMLTCYITDVPWEIYWLSYRYEEEEEKKNESQGIIGNGILFFLFRCCCCCYCCILLQPYIP